MPRSLWSGSLSFGLVNVPVRLVSGARVSRRVGWIGRHHLYLPPHPQGISR